MELKYVVREGKTSDLHKIAALYRTVASRSGGIAREADEVTEAYVRSFIEKSLESGIILTIEDPENPETLIAEVHTYKPGIKVFAHIFSDLTIVVHPNHQGKGVEKLLFGALALMEKIEAEYPEVLRVELIARESNEKAIDFYKKFGFRVEGRLEKRISDKIGKLEADIPMGWIRLGRGGQVLRVSGNKTLVFSCLLNYFRFTDHCSRLADFMAGPVPHTPSIIDRHGNRLTFNFLHFIYSFGAYKDAFPAACAFLRVNIFYECRNPFTAIFSNAGQVFFVLVYPAAAGASWG